MKYFTQLIYTFVWLLSYTNTLPPINNSDQPFAPDYSNNKNWSALPFRNDAADLTPKNEKWMNDSLKYVDVFYIYPTIFTKGNTWNADLNNKKLNKRIDHLPVKYQASIFNQVGRVYAPRYRQAIIDSYFDTTGSGKKALDFAYEDIKKAFEYYLQHYNNGRPIIIVSHSQGTTHSRRLLQDYFDTPEMKSKLVCAYVVGFEIYKEDYKLLTLCQDEKETNCYVTWSTFKEGFQYKEKLHYFGNVCVNPVSWRTDSMDAVSHGGVLLNINRKKKFITSTRIYDNYLWAKTNLTFMRKKKVLHLVDFNLFWYDIRKNVALRVDEYFINK